MGIDNGNAYVSSDSTAATESHPIKDDQKTSDPKASQTKQNFDLNRLSPEDRAILKNISRDANIYRGYPFAAMCGGVAYFGIRYWFPKFSPPGRIALTLTAGIIGNVVGRVTYFPLALKILENELPPDSQLRQFIESTKEQARLRESLQRPHNFTGLRPETLRSDESPGKMLHKPYQSYDQMRKVHREQEKNLQPSFSSSTSLSEYIDADYVDSQPSKKTRYNKYGDPILE